MLTLFLIFILERLSWIPPRQHHHPKRQSFYFYKLIAEKFSKTYDFFLFYRNTCSFQQLSKSEAIGNRQRKSPWPLEKLYFVFLYFFIDKEKVTVLSLAFGEVENRRHSLELDEQHKPTQNFQFFSCFLFSNHSREFFLVKVWRHQVLLDYQHHRAERCSANSRLTFRDTHPIHPSI